MRGVFLKTSILLGLVCHTLSLAQEQEKVLLKNVESFRKDRAALHAYDGGLRSSEAYHGKISSLSFYSVFHENTTKSYGDVRFDRTIEKSIYTNVSWSDASGNLWFTGIDFSDSHQDIHRVSELEQLNNFRQITLGFYQGLNLNLSHNMRFKIFSGASTCYYLDGGNFAILPVGGVSLSKNYKYGNVQLELIKSAEGTGETSGLYGSQSRRDARLSARALLGKKLELVGHCTFTMVDTNFSEQNAATKAKFMTANLEMRYQLHKQLSARANIAHKSFLTDDFTGGTPEGLTGSVSVNYLVF